MLYFSLVTFCLLLLHCVVLGITQIRGRLGVCTTGYLENFQ